MSVSEGNISRDIQDGLRQLGWKVLRQQSGKVKVRGGWMILGQAGTPDLLAFNSAGRPFWIEVKTAEGKRSAEQVEFESWARDEMGHLYLCARSLDDVLTYLKETK